MLTTPTRPPAASQLGNLIGDYPGSWIRYLWLVVGAFCAFVVIANLSPGTSDSSSIYSASDTSGNAFFLLVWVALGIGCFAEFFFRLRGLHAWVFEQGFIITRGDNTTSYRWEHVANVEHWVKTTYTYFIPTSRSHYYVVTMVSGKKVKLGSTFRDARKLGQSVQLLWTRNAAQQLRARTVSAVPPAATAVPSYSAPPLPAPTAVPQIAASATPPSLGTSGVVQWGANALPPPPVVPPTASPAMPPADSVPTMPPAMPPAGPPPAVPSAAEMLPAEPPPIAPPPAAAPSDAFAPAPVPNPIPPSRILSTDISVGAGPVAQAGQRVSIHYTGWLTNGTKFDSSIDRGPPLQFVLGSGQVLAGLDEGVVGMHVGGKRRITIPPDLAYGAAGAGDAIPPGATLIFEIHLMSAL